MTESGLPPLPENAVELEKAFSFPSGLFRTLRKITQDPSGYIYVSDGYENNVFKFNPSGESICRIDGKGRGKLREPNNISATNDALYVEDLEKETILCMDPDGKYQKTLNISDLSDFFIDQNGNLYAAPNIKDKNTPLVQVHFFERNSLRSFGKPIFFRHSMDVLNSRTMAVDSRGELWVAFTYFPIVRKYSQQGELISEFRIKSPIMEAKEQYNLKKLGRGIVRSSQRVGYLEIIVDIEAYGDKLYLLSHHPRLEITEVQENGTLGTTFWKEFLEVYKTKGFVIQEKEGELRFIVLRSDDPNDSVDVFKETEKDQLSPFERAVKDLTDTIQINPNYWRAYHNRALLKYNHKDFKGAVEDFTKAIDLNPQGASAYYNRGNCRVNLDQYNRAVEDFSLAIEIDPQHATAYFNRGIAFMHKKEFDKAIEDFRKSAYLDSDLAEKAWRQINICMIKKINHTFLSIL